jgi:hypothetical protein
VSAQPRSARPGFLRRVGRVRSDTLRSNSEDHSRDGKHPRDSRPCRRDHGMNGSRPTATRASTNLSLTNGFGDSGGTFRAAPSCQSSALDVRTEFGAATSRAQRLKAGEGCGAQLRCGGPMTEPQGLAPESAHDRPSFCPATSRDHHMKSSRMAAQGTCRHRRRLRTPILLETSCSGQKNYAANWEVVAHASERLAPGLHRVLLPLAAGGSVLRARTPAMRNRRRVTWDQNFYRNNMIHIERNTQ